MKEKNMNEFFNLGELHANDIKEKSISFDLDIPENLNATVNSFIINRIVEVISFLKNQDSNDKKFILFTNAKLACILQDTASFIPVEESYYKDCLSLGYLPEICHVYADPYMTWDDTRICIGYNDENNSKECWLTFKINGNNDKLFF